MLWKRPQRVPILDLHQPRMGSVTKLENVLKKSVKDSDNCVVLHPSRQRNYATEELDTSTDLQKDILQNEGVKLGDWHANKLCYSRGVKPDNILGKIKYLGLVLRTEKI